MGEEQKEKSVDNFPVISLSYLQQVDSLSDVHALQHLHLWTDCSEDKF